VSVPPVTPTHSDDPANAAAAPRRLYMDNAATSFPKPPVVYEAMMRFATQLGASPGRGAYAEAREAGELMLECRRRLCRLFGADPARPEHVIFTLNTSDALNLAIRGLLLAPTTADKGHVVTTWLDHNSVLRPYNALAAPLGVEQSRVKCDPRTGLVDPDDIRRAIRPDTQLIAIVHGSNVTGTLQPIREIGRIAREHDIPFLVDAAQTLGHYPVNVEADFIDLLAFPGHKGLLGPLGTGGLWIRPGIEKRMTTVREGGTGSVSEADTQPDFLPDRFEPGSHNAIGIIGLSAGVQWILDRGKRASGEGLSDPPPLREGLGEGDAPRRSPETFANRAVNEQHHGSSPPPSLPLKGEGPATGVAALWSHERELIGAFLGALDEAAIPGLTLFGPQGVKDRCAVFSVRMEGLDEPQSLSDLLEREYGILTRSGIHCAPLAHRTFGTHHLGGMTRFSFGSFLSSQDVRYAVDALSRIHEGALVG